MCFFSGCLSSETVITWQQAFLVYRFCFILEIRSKLESRCSPRVFSHQSRVPPSRHSSRAPSQQSVYVPPAQSLEAVAQRPPSHQSIKSQQSVLKSILEYKPEKEWWGDLRCVVLSSFSEDVGRGLTTSKCSKFCIRHLNDTKSSNRILFEIWVLSCRSPNQ